MNNKDLAAIAAKIGVASVMSNEDFRIKCAVDKALKEAGYVKKNDLVEKLLVGFFLVLAVSFVLILSAVLRSADPWYGYCGYWRRYWW